VFLCFTKDKNRRTSFLIELYVISSSSTSLGSLEEFKTNKMIFFSIILDQLNK